MGDNRPKIQTFHLKRLFQLPLQWRLTLWYLLTLSFILLLFTAFLYLQMRQSLLHQLDASLHLVASQIQIHHAGEQLTFQEAANPANSPSTASNAFIFYLADPNGEVWDTAGLATGQPLFWPPTAGITTVLTGDDNWRVLSQEVTVSGLNGWLQISGDMDPINDTLDRLLALMLVGGPLALILAGIGGFFMAGRALHPIDRITRTAQAITVSDLNQRIAYAGPADEVGRLAHTFDGMLNRLQTAFERERRFTSDAAHELRTPLAALKGRIGVTLGQPRQPQVYVETLQEMEGQVDRIIHLSNDLLLMARLEQGAMVRQVEQIDVGDFLGAVVDQVRPLAQAKFITFTEDIPTGLALHGDMDLLIRLFLNLLDNAVKFTPENGRITLTGKQKDAILTIAISNTGPGIPPKHLPHLFERFYRAEGDRGRSHQGGAGLGLAIAHEIVRKHNGRLAVHSELGRGTTFTVELPHSS